MQSGLQDQVLAIAAEYPGFFTMTPQAGEEAGPGGYYPLFVNSPSDFSCTSGCTPGWSSALSAGAGVAGAITSLSTSPSLAAQLLGVEDQFLNALKSGNSLANAATAAATGNVGMTIVDIGDAIAQGAGLAAATGAEATAIAAVGSVWAAFKAGYAIGTAVNLVVECEQWQTAHACGSSCCDNGLTCVDPTTSTCSGGDAGAADAGCSAATCDAAVDAPGEAPSDGSTTGDSSTTSMPDSGSYACPPSGSPTASSACYGTASAGCCPSGSVCVETLQGGGKGLGSGNFGCCVEAPASNPQCPIGTFTLEDNGNGNNIMCLKPVYTDAGQTIENPAMGATCLPAQN